jgi:hypothetical protein
MQKPTVSSANHWYYLYALAFPILTRQKPADDQSRKIRLAKLVVLAC